MNRPQRPQNEWLNLLPISLITLLGAILRFYHSGKRQFWGDEIHNFEVANAPSSITELFKTWWNASYVADPPLFYMLGFLNVNGASSYSHLRLRALSVLLGILCIPMTYLLASQWLSKRVALIAALFVSMSAFAIEYSQEYRPYSMLMLSSLVLLHAYSLLSHALNRKNLAYAIVATIVLVYTHLFGFIALIPAYLIMIVAAWRHRPSMSRSKQAMMLGLIPVSAFLTFIPMVSFLISRAKYHSPALSPKSESAQFIAKLSREQGDLLQKLGEAFLTYRDGEAGSFYRWLASALLLLGLIGLWRRSRSVFASMIFWLIVSALLTMAFYVGLQYHFEVRRNIFQFPLMAIVLAAGVSLPGELIQRYTNGAIAKVLGMGATLIIAGIVCFLALKSYVAYDARGWRTESGQADWQGMARFVSSVASEKDSIIVPVEKDSTWRHLHFRYYFAQTPPRAKVTVLRPTEKLADHRTKPLWYLVTQPWLLPEEDMKLLLLQGEWAQFYGGAVVYLPQRQDTKEQYLLLSEHQRAAIVPQGGQKGTLVVQGPFRKEVEFSKETPHPVLDFPHGLYSLSWKDSGLTTPVQLFSERNLERVEGGNYTESKPSSGQFNVFMRDGIKSAYLMHNGALLYNFLLDKSGDYELSLTVKHDKPGPVAARVWITGMPELPRLTFDKGNNEFGTVTVPVTLRPGPISLRIYFDRFSRVKDQTLKPEDQFTSFELLQWSLLPASGT